MKRTVFAALRAARAGGRPVALATNLTLGQQLLIYEDGTEGELCLDVDMMMAATAALKDDRAVTLKTPRGPVFVQPFNLPARMIVVGAVHIAQPLVQMAALTGYGVTLVDPRQAFATESRFPGLSLSDEWPDQALARLQPDRRTAVVTLTHDPKLDDPALATALRSPAFYIGALGSRKTHAARLARLAQAGFNEAELARIHGPVGMAIGAVSPAEIAVSILADVTRARRSGADA